MTATAEDEKKKAELTTALMDVILNSPSLCDDDFPLIMTALCECMAAVCAAGVPPSHDGKMLDIMQKRLPELISKEREALEAEDGAAGLAAFLDPNPSGTKH